MEVDDEESQISEVDTDLQAKENDDVPRKKAGTGRASRRRTKTGCLTCRKRRIKCGEERPRCGNCVKSKRQCEGYNQRVIFKDPVNTSRYTVSAASEVTTFRTGPSTKLNSASQYQFQSPPPHLGTTLRNHTLSLHGSLDGQQLQDSSALNLLNRPDGNTRQNVFWPPDVDRSLDGTAHVQIIDARRPLGAGLIHEETKEQITATSHKLKAPIESESNQSNSLDQSDYSGEWVSDPSSAAEPSFQEEIYHSDIKDVASSIVSHTREENVKRHLHMAQQDPRYHQFSSNSSPQGDPITIGLGARYGWLPEAANSLRIEGSDLFHLERGGPHVQQFPTVEVQGMMVDDEITAVVEDGPLRWGYLSDDDPFDVTDDEVQQSGETIYSGRGNAQHDHLKENDLGIMVALQAARDRQDRSLRTYHSFIDGYGPEVLATYRPSAQSSPLNDSMTARIFCHFINVTAPCISMFERHPANPSLIFQGRPVPKSQQHIWAYTMPTLALSNTALLHAILALGSLHMAKLQDGPITAPLKHYHLALRRVGKAVSLPTRRGQPATLAATMLLGWFEIMSSDHSKWTGHVLGARLLLQGIDFSGMTRYLKTKKIQQRQAQYGGQLRQDTTMAEFDDFYQDQGESSQYLPADDDVNENLVSMIMGKKLQYDQYGQVLDDINALDNADVSYTQRDIETYETQRDLFWWYCKQDSFQSILGGTKLLLSYDLWSHCPPRASVGRKDAIYGTWDHLILLLGRLAEFSAKDLKRKRRAMKTAGPLPGGPVKSNPAGEHGQPTQGQNQTKARNQQMPPFAGMLPGTGGKVYLPRGFSPPREESPDDTGTDDRTLEEETTEAEEEWQEIHSAFNTLRDNFGPDFQALGPEYSQPIQTPFGSALQYRTFGIAGIWMSYYTGLIVLHRAHPSMPPAAMIAVGVAARQTGFYANEIGRIAAAIAPNACEIQQVSTGIGAALIESSFPLFVAGVQFQDSSQRTWTIQRCFDLRRLTGWQTAHSIAIGCETSWLKAAAAGRGPPYNRGPEWKTPSTALDLVSRRAQILSGGANDTEGEIFSDDVQNRVHYALGLLAVEEDLGNLRLQDNDGA